MLGPVAVLATLVGIGLVTGSVFAGFDETGGTTPGSAGHAWLWTYGTAALVALWLLGVVNTTRTGGENS